MRAITSSWRILVVEKGVYRDFDRGSDGLVVSKTSAAGEGGGGGHCTGGLPDEEAEGEDDDEEDVAP